MNILRFETDTPVEVALKYVVGRDVDGRYGLQVLYTLVDDRLMYLEPKVARRVDQLRITAGEPFSICKREVKNGQKRTTEGEVKRLQPVSATAQLELIPPFGNDDVGEFKTTTRIDAGPAEQQTVGPVALDLKGQAHAGTARATAAKLEDQLRASI